jgi:branched-chain amino acid transport system permease protein
MGGIYAIISMGLSMQYGVAKILNVAHGEFIMIGAFLTLTFQRVGINPLWSLLLCAPPIFLIGFVLHRTAYKRLTTITGGSGAFEGNAMLISFGIMFILQNAALMIWGTNAQTVTFMNKSINIFGSAFGASRIVVRVIAIIVSVGFYVVLSKSRMGKSIRAAAQDPVAASLMGVKINRIMAICFAIGAMLAGLAGVLRSMISPIYTTMGMGYTITAIIVVVLGGLGSIPGSMIGGFILGIVGAAVARIDISLQIVVFYLIILALLIVRPKGLFGR